MATSITSIRDLAASVRGRRRSLGLSQAQLAGRAHVSRQWVGQFEAGRPTAELRLVLQVLEALDLRLTLDERDGDRREPSSAIDLDALLDEHRRER